MMTPLRKKEYLIMDKNTGKVLHEGTDRRSILPNQGDFFTQVGISIATGIILAFMGFVGYCGDTAYHGVLNSIAEAKNSQESSMQKIWSKVNVLEDYEALSGAHFAKIDQELQDFNNRR